MTFTKCHCWILSGSIFYMIRMPAIYISQGYPMQQFCALTGTARLQSVQTGAQTTE